MRLCWRKRRKGWEKSIVYGKKRGYAREKEGKGERKVYCKVKNRNTNAETLGNSKSDWYLDSSTTSHITNDWNAFTEFTATSATPVLGIGNPAMTLGYSTISIKFKVNNNFITHKLQHTLYIPGAPNCLLSASRFDKTGGKVIIQKGKCSLEDKWKYCWTRNITKATISNGRRNCPPGKSKFCIGN